MLLLALLACKPLEAADSDRDAADTDAADTDAADTDAAEGSWCDVADGAIACTHNTTAIVADGVSREVHWQVPKSAPPAGGYPVALVFQGSYISAERNWYASEGETFGVWYQVQATKALLDAGYAVVTPETRGDGGTYWDTNIYPWNVAWESSPDHALMVEIFDGLEEGAFGDVDSERLFAAGLSSGGYMTSRMAISYPGRFAALAVHSASYATCAGAACAVPDLPADHPPTLFLHGEADSIVPIWTMELYRAELDAQGTPVDAEIDAGAGHEWLAAAPERLVAWFDAAP